MPTLANSQWAAERALDAIQHAIGLDGRRGPTGSYCCGLCKAWHLSLGGGVSHVGPDVVLVRRSGSQRPGTRCCDLSDDPLA